MCHNTGHGSFVEVTDKAGFGKHTGWTLDIDIGHGDFNNDGLQDVYLACDYGTDRIFLMTAMGLFATPRKNRSGSTDERA